jgi:hypothetical protein
MIVLRLVMLLLGFSYSLGINDISALSSVVSEEFEKCKIVANDQARLSCLKMLLQASPENSAVSAPRDPWPLVRTPNPGGGPDAVSIMRTVDIARSDPDLAGVMIRCGEKQSLEILLVLIRPIPPRAKRDVVLSMGSTEIAFGAEAASAGSALVLPIDATALTTGPWRDANELNIKIKDRESDISGAISLEGVVPAIARLSASCPPPER